MSQNAAQRARELLESNPLFFDTETTGLGRSDEIVEVGIVDTEGKTLLQSLVRPVGRIPVEASAVHGITNEMVRGAPTWESVWREVRDLFEGRTVGIFNAEFDLRMMRQSHERRGMQWQPMGPWERTSSPAALLRDEALRPLLRRTARYTQRQMAGAPEGGTAVRNPQPQRAPRRGRRPPHQPGLPPHGQAEMSK